jgi:hypothetical protein
MYTLIFIIFIYFFLSDEQSDFENNSLKETDDVSFVLFIILYDSNILLIISFEGLRGIRGNIHKNGSRTP